VNQINSQIHSVNDLRGKAVETNSIYQASLQARYGLITSEFVFNGNQDLLDAADAVLRGDLTALITDAPLIEWQLSEQQGCTLRMLPDIIDPFSYGITFKVGTSVAVVDTFSGTSSKMLLTAS